MIQTIARHHIYKDTLHPPLERHSRAEKNPTMTKIVLLWQEFIIKEGRESIQLQ